MKLRMAAALVLIGCMATAALADNGRGNQRGNGSGDNRDDARSGQVDVVGDGDSGRGNDTVHRSRGPEQRAESQTAWHMRQRHQARMEQPCGERQQQAQCQPRCEARPQACQPKPSCTMRPAMQCRPRSAARCGEPPRTECRPQAQPARGERQARPAGGTVTAPADGRVHDDNGHGNDPGHADPSNPGNGGGNHGTRNHD